jgi:hypothetical protein
MTWNPFEAATAWANERDSATEPTTVPATNEGHPGTQVTDLGWLVLGTVLVGGVFMLVYHGISAAYSQPRVVRVR